VARLEPVKSTWALALAGAVSTGCEFAGLKTQFAPVLYLDRENPQAIAQQRLRDQCIETGRNFHYWGSWVQPEARSLDDSIIVEYVKECSQKPFIILDSLAEFNSGDENDVRQMRAFLNPARDLAHMGASVLIIHHTGKAETAQKFRGSSAIADSVDVAFGVTNPSKGQKLEHLEIKAFKTRFLVAPKHVFRYSEGEFGNVDAPRLATSTMARSADPNECLRRLLSENPEISTSKVEALAVRHRFARDRARQFLNDGIMDGTIAQMAGPKRSNLYFLIPHELAS
jgi:hypothetical protein